uniref:Protocadherin-8 n=1 Tax=Hucho hucho TaxID=62062 RepID=A0A4W5M727_9TELE
MGFCGFRGVGECVVLAVLFYSVQSTTTRYYTYEEDAPWTEIGNLSQDLKIDPADDPQTSFRFMQETNSCVIQMREIDGLLTVGETIDREQLCPRSPRCFVTFDIVAFSKEKFQLIHVEIEVRDINDNSPQFLHNETTLEISENVQVDSRFPLDIAVDHDVGNNYIQSYHISPSSHFIVDVRSREDGVKYAELVLVKAMDREAEDSYTIEVKATDGGEPPRSGSMTVHIKVLDFNDNSPTFEHNSLKVELYEDSPVGYQVLKVHAFDSDADINGEVVYGFVEDTSSEEMRIFNIDRISGAVTLKTLVDYEKKISYELNIKASDLGTNSIPSTCKVVVDVVDVNDNAPEITIKPKTSTTDDVAYITEAAAEESFVALISTSDSDSGSNGYVRSSLHGHEHFKLQQAYGDTFMIVTTTTLDREKIPEYNLTVVAEDLGTPPFKTIKQYTIRVTDENDNAPLFSKSIYEVSVLENNIPGSYITTVVARDLDRGKNAKVSYKLIDSEVVGEASISTYVSIDPVSGSLYSLRSFDFETLKQIELTIQADDKGSPQLSSTSVIRIKVVDQNDNYPYFTFPVMLNDSAEIPLPVNAPLGYLALQVKGQDEDEGMNGELSYRIVQGDSKIFSINKDTGEIAVKQGLASAIGDVLEIKIALSDSGRSPLSSSATIRFVVTDLQVSDDQLVIVLRSSDEESAGLDISVVVIIILGGGCTLLLIAIAIVVITCKLNRGGKDHDSKRDVTHSLFDSRRHPRLNSAEPNMFGDPRGFLNERTSSSHDESSLYEEKNGELESQMFLPPKPFQPSSVWQGDKYYPQISSGIDQQSVKDSGKGDSDFNDSDSDISGDGGKRSLRTFQPWAKGSFHAANTLAVDCQGTYCVISTQSFQAPRDNAYTIGFSQAPVYNNAHAYPHSWKDSGYNTSIPKERNTMQTFSHHTGTLPSYFTHQKGQSPAGLDEIQEHNQDITTVTTTSEVATIL